MTGATGFIGRRLVPALLANGATVTVLLRSRHGARGLKKAGAKVVVGSLGDHAAVLPLLRGQDVLFHLAYDLRAPAEDNLAEFEVLIGAAETAGVGRIVQTSSIVVYDDWPSGDLTEESTISSGSGGPYRLAKIAMEQRLMESPTPVAVLEPTLVYGPGSALWTDQFGAWLAAGKVVLPVPEGVCNAVFVDDVVQAMLRAALLEDLVCERFLISGGGPIAWSALLDGYAAILGKGGTRHVDYDDLAARLAPDVLAEAPSKPSMAARISALGRKLLGRTFFEWLVRRAKRLRPAEGDTYPDRFLLELFSAQGTCDIRHARARLGYRPGFGLEQGLDATADYLRRRHG